jgi:hypothetical protein
MQFKSSFHKERTGKGEKQHKKEIDHGRVPFLLENMINPKYHIGYTPKEKIQNNDPHFMLEIIDGKDNTRYFHIGVKKNQKIVFPGYFSDSCFIIHRIAPNTDK